MKLYGYVSFNPQKVQWALAELELAYEFQFVKLHKREHFEEPIISLNPNKRVPILEVDGQVLWESNAILTYLGEREGRLWPSNLLERSEAMKWLFYESTNLAPNMGAVWYMDTVGNAMGKEPDEKRYESATKECHRILSILEEHLSEHDWMLGAEFSLVDCAYGPVLDALNASRFDLSAYAAVNAYMRCVRDRPHWQMRNGHKPKLPIQ